MGSSKTFAPEAIICNEAHGEAIICKPSISLFTKTAVAVMRNSASEYHQQAATLNYLNSISEGADASLGPVSKGGTMKMSGGGAAWHSEKKLQNQEAVFLGF